MAEALNRILSGNLSQVAGGFLLQMPDGVAGREFFRAALIQSYGNEHHPDLRVLDPEKQIISVDEVRDLREFLSTSPMGDGMKTLLVVAAERMNTQSANAFLKSLEEPSKHTRIIIATDRPWALPATVLSRCHKLGLKLTRDMLVDEVKFGLEDVPDRAAIEAALALADDNPTAARDVLIHDLEAWHKSAIKWIANPAGPPPAAPGSPKAAPSLDTLFRLLQRSIIMQMRGETCGLNWGVERADEALKILSRMSIGINRAGLDWKTRLSATLFCLANMETAH